MAKERPTDQQVRDWETETGRGHRAAAEHFGITVDEARDMYRRAGQAPRASFPPPEPTRARAKPEPPPAPPQGSPLAQLPAVVPPPPRSEPGSLPWWREELAELTEQRDKLKGNAREGQAYAQLTRSIQKTAETIAEMVQAEKAKSATHLTTAQRMERLEGVAKKMPEVMLVVYVREWYRRRGEEVPEAAAPNREEAASD